MRKSVLAAVVLAALAASPSVLADVKLPAILGSNMVLQQNRELPLWGTADPGEAVTVTLGDAKAADSGDSPLRRSGPPSGTQGPGPSPGGCRRQAVADAQGKWLVKLPPQKAGGPVEITVAGKNTLKLANVLVGEVWVCSGQSNMAMVVASSANKDKEIAAAACPKIRLFTVDRKTALEPQSDCKGAWVECDPKTVGGFSAVAYFFGRKLHQELQVPVGLVHTSWGGTPAEAWTERSFLHDPALASLHDRWKKVIEEYPKALEKHKQDVAKWEETVKRLQGEHQARMREWQEKVKAAKGQGPEAKAPEGKAAAGAALPPRPEAPKLPPKPREPQGPNSPHCPSSLYNAMIHPLLPFAAQGAIWYQGESNAGRAFQYRTLFPTMIKSWRKAWGDEDLDFYFVQLANFQRVVTTPPAPSADWAELREAQTMTLALPKTGQACIIDIGEANDIHPKNKQDAGLRLALSALAGTYGKAIPFVGPTFDSIAVEGGSIRVKFQHLEGGLVAKPFSDPVRPDGPRLAQRFALPLGEMKPAPAKAGKAGKQREPASAEPPATTAVPVEGAAAPLVVPRPKSEVYGFAIAGEDKKFVWAEAKIDGDTVVVSSDQVTAPVAVRYAWADNPECNLSNSTGIPASPFRTDEWPGITINSK